MSLILSRRINEAFKINGPCEVKVVRLRGNRVYLSVKAEREVIVLRSEIEGRRSLNGCNRVEVS
jgi:carbon storage regulator CsrA